MAIAGLYGGNVFAGDKKVLPKRIYFNLYTDSIKTVLNYYVNVEGEYPDGSFLPLDTSVIAFSYDNGKMLGNEWIAPKQIDFKTVSFRVWLREAPQVSDSIKVWMKQGIDPRDSMELPQEPEEIRKRNRR